MTDGLTIDIASRAIGSALLHSVWQGALAAAVTATVLRLLRDASAHARYVVACAGLAALVGGFALTAAYSLSNVSNVEGGLQTALTSTPTAPLLGPGPLDFSSAIRDIRPSDATLDLVRPSWPARLERWSTAAVPLWFAGVLILSARLGAGWVSVARLRRVALLPASSDLVNRVAILARRVGVSRVVRVTQSAAVQVPAVAGWLRPILLLPVSAVTGLTPVQLDAVVAHELAHVRRHDYAVNLLQSMAETLLFYHPVCWWLSRRIRTEREHCCDDIAVSVCGDRLVYASALTELETLRQQPALALAATDGSLLRRVRRLVASPDPASPPAWQALLFPLAVVAIAIGGVAVTRAQQPPEQVRVPGMGRTIPGDRGVIEGQVVEAGTGRPIAGARVDVRGPSGQVYATTDQSGRYETEPLTPGSYAVSVSAPGHATAFYEGRTGSMSGHSSIDGSITVSGPSASAPRITLTGNVEIRTSTSVDVRAGSLVSNIDVAMQATGHVSGRILDDRGRGLPGAFIRLVGTQAAAIGTGPHIAFARSETDGTYRVTAAPGDYIVVAYAAKPVRPSRDATLAYTTTFFPGVHSLDEAQPVRLSAGAEQYDVDFALLSSRTVRVSGVVVDPAGTDLEDVKVSLRGGPFDSGGAVELPLNTHGEFDTRDVVPGRYQIDVTDPRRPARWKVAREPFEIAEDVTGLEIRAVGAASISGRIVRDSHSTGHIDLTQALVSFVHRGEGLAMNSSIFNTEADGAFHGDVPSGSLTLMVMGFQGWTTRAIRLDGVEVFGYPLELAPGAHEIEIVVTDHLGSAGGLVVDRRGTPLGGFDVVLFPEDEARWHYGSPLVRQTRSSQNGRFELPLLPPGDYLAVATEGVPFLMIGDPAPTLRRLQSIATRLKLGDGEQKTISIRASPSPLAP